MTAPGRRPVGLTPLWSLALVAFVTPWGCQWAETAPTTESRACTVRSIHDGDTLRLRCGGERLQVRLYCIDAPEMEQEPWGRWSRDYLRTITPKQVRLIPRDQDTYGRTVAEIFTDDAKRPNLNLAMVRSGNAAVYRSYCHDDSYYQAQKEARKNHAGIWQWPGPHQTPWSFRH